MFLKKPAYIVVIGFVIILAVVVGYQILKFDYFEENLIKKIKLHNKALEIYFTKLEKLDSTSLKKFNKNNFYYLTETKELPASFENSFEDYYKWVKNRTNKIILENNKMGLLILNFKKKDTIPDEFFELLEDDNTQDSGGKIDKKLLYSPDELDNINEEADEERIDLYNKQNKRKVKK